MDNTLFGMKEIYDAILTASYDMTINGQLVMAGEPIIVFKSLQIVDFSEFKEHINATGGYGNQVWVSWDRTKDLTMRFSQGVMSKLHLALLANANMETKNDILVPMWEELETDENCQIELRHVPADENIWAYDIQGNHLHGDLEGKVITFRNAAPYTDVMISYSYRYIKDSDVINIGRQLFPGHLQMTMKTRLKDDITGKTVTGIFNIPKLKLMSDFSIRLGSDASPATGNFVVTAYPTGSKGNEKVMDFIILKDDSDSDI